MRLYRDCLGTWITRFAVLRAVVSVSALGTGAAVQVYPMVWAGIIAAAQVADALQNAIPFAARHRGSQALVIALEALFINCQREWEEIFAGRIQGQALAERRLALRMRRHEAETKALPAGLPTDHRLMRLAETRATDYLKTMYPEGPLNERYRSG